MRRTTCGNKASGLGRPTQGAHSYVPRVTHGDAAHAIVDLSNEFPDAFVAMTSHGRSGVGRWVMGSVTNRVVRYAAGPVLVTRSE